MILFSNGEKNIETIKLRAVLDLNLENGLVCNSTEFPDSLILKSDIMEI